MLLLLASLSEAAPHGNPARSAETSVVGVQAGGGWQGRSLETGCEGERCSTWATGAGGELRVELRPHAAVGLWAGGAWVQEELSGTGHVAWGPSAAGGLLLQVPRRGLSPALSLKGELGRSSIEAGPKQDPRSESRWWEVQVAGLAAFGEPEGGACGWIGPSFVLAEAHDLDVNTDDVAIELTRSTPVGLVAGGELLSAELGQPWRRSARMVAGLEVQAVHAWGASAWIGFAY